MAEVHRSHDAARAGARGASSYSEPSPARAVAPAQSRVRAVAIAVAAVAFVLAACTLGVIAYSYWQGQRSYDSLAQRAFEPDDSLTDARGSALCSLSVDWDALLAVNPDTVGWVYIPGTAVNYPIVKAPEDYPGKYLVYDFEGNKGGSWLPTYGAPYLLSTNAADFSDKNNIVQGHHLLNGEMFSAIADFAGADVFNAHRNVYLLTPKGNYRLGTVSLVHCAGSEHIAQTEFSTDGEFADYVRDKLDRSVVSADPQVLSASDISQLFMFTTCDGDDDMRYVLCCAPVEFAPAGSRTSISLVGRAAANQQDQGDRAGEIDAAASDVDDAAKEIVS